MTPSRYGGSHIDAACWRGTSRDRSARMSDMDPLTQGLLGAVTAQLGFRQRIGSASATWLAAGAAMAADLDIFAGVVGRLFGVEVGTSGIWRYHRGISHSLFAAPLIALLVAVPWWLCRRRGKTRDGPASASLGLLFACLTVAALSHLFLDWCTAYGTQLLAPFSDRRFALDAIAIVDIIFTPILLATVLTCWVVRRCRGARSGRATIVVASVGLALSMGYIATGCVLRDQVVRQARELARVEQARTQSSAKILDVRAYPYIGTVLLWRATVEFEDRWLVARIRPLGGAGAVRSNTVAKVDNVFVRKARGLEQLQTYAWFADDQLRAAYRNDGTRHVVELHDMRYAPSPDSIESLWPVRVTFASGGNVVRIERLRSRKRRRSIGQFVTEVWREITAP